MTANLLEIPDNQEYTQLVKAIELNREVVNIMTDLEFNGKCLETRKLLDEAHELVVKARLKLQKVRQAVMKENRENGYVYASMVK